MRIQQVEIFNWRSIEHAVLDLTGVNVIWAAGDNGEGKTSLWAALYFACTGRTPWSDGHGKGLDRVVTWGGTEAYVALTFADGRRIKMAIPAKQQQLADYARQVVHAIADRPNVPVESLLSVRSFLADRGDQVDVLFRATGQRLDRETYLAYLAKDDAFPGQATWLSDRWAAWPVDPYKAAYNARTEANGALKLLEAQSKAGVAEEPPVVEQQQLDDVVKNRTFAGQMVAELKSKLSRPEDAYKTQLASWQALKRQVDAAKVERAQTQADVRSAELELGRTIPVHQSEEECRIELGNIDAALQTTAQERTAQLGVIDRQVEEARRASAAATADLQAMEKEPRCSIHCVNNPVVDADCPNCGRPLAGDPERRARLQNAIAAAAAKVTELSAQRSDIEANIAACEAKLREKRQHFDGALQTALRFANQRETAQKRLDTATAKLATLQEPQELPDEPEPPDLDELRENLMKWEGLHAGYERDYQALLARKQTRATWEADVARWHEMQAQIDSQRETHKRWDNIVKLFEPDSPKGVKARVLDASLKTVEDRINADLQTYFGMRCSVSSVQGIWLTEEGRNELMPVHLANNGHMALASAVFQVELARLYGFPFIAIDEHSLAPRLRIKLLQYLSQQTDIQCLVLSLLNQLGPDGKMLPPSPVPLPGVGVFWVHDHQIDRIGVGVPA